MAQDVIITPASGKIEFSNNAVVAATIQLDSADGNLNIPNTTDVHFQNTTGTAPFLVDSTTKVTNLNADLLDGVSVGNLLRSDTSDSFTSGTLTFNSGTTLTAAAGATVNFSNTTGTAPFTVASTTTVTNLSADLLDGISSASFLRSDANDTATGVITFDGGTTSSAGPIITGSAVAGPALKIKSTATNGNDWWIISNNSSNTDGAGRMQLWNNTGSFTAATIGHLSSVATKFYTDFEIKGNTAWHAGNDGSGSGLDADTLDGSHASAFLTGNQTITLSGDVSGSGTTAITVTVADDSHNHIISNVDGLQTALDGKLSTTGTAANSQLLDSIDSTSFVRSDQDDTITGDLHFSGGLAGYGTSRVHVLRPDGADYQTQASSVTGALQITLPVGYVSDMMLMWVDVFDYAGDTDGESFSMILGGYNYSSSESWINCFAHVISSRSDKFYTVRFGDNGSSPATNVIIWIGETSSTWSYPQVNVRDFYSGYSTSNTAYTDGWSIGFATSFATVNKVVTAGLHADKATYATVSAHPGTNWYPLVAHNGDSLISDTSVDLHDSGYVRAVYFNTTHNTTNRTADTIFYSSTDAYIRRNDGAGFRTSLNVPTRTGGDASGTWGISITGNAATATSATSAGNADTVDSLHAASFLRSDTNDTFTGTLTTGELQIFANHPVHTGYSGIGNTEAWTTTTAQYLIISAGTDTYVNGDNVYIRAGNNLASNELKVTTSGSFIGGNTVWHAGNDGAASGLDADTLDGQHGSYYAVKTYWPDSVTNIGKTAQGLVNFTSLADYEKPGGYQTMMRGTNTEATVVGTPKAANYWYFNVMAVRDTANGVAALLMNYDNGDFYWGTSADPSAGAIPWRRVWSDNDFTSTTVGQWNTAYGWGNHALGGYATASNTMTFTNKSGNISQWTNNSGYITGNQTITLSGDATGSGTTAITVTVADDSHNHIISNVDGLQTALDARPTIIVTADNISTRINSGFYQTASASTSNGYPVTATYYHLFSLTHSNTNNYYAMQLAADYYSQDNFYFRSTNSSGTQAWSEIWTSSSDGSGSGLDADTLDGVQSNQFMRSDVEDTTYGSVIIAEDWASGTYNSAFVIQGTYPSWETRSDATQDKGWLHHQDASGNYTLYSIASYSGNNWTQRFTFNHGDQTFRNGGPTGNVYYHQGNDGSGSGLDADLLDGIDSGSFLRSDTNDTYTGNLYLAATASIRGTTGGAWSGNPGANGKIEYHANRWYIVSDSSSNRIVQFRRDGTDVSYIDNSGNFIGSADTVDGYHYTSFVPSAGVYRTTASGSGRIRFTSPFAVTGGNMFQVTLSLYKSYTIDTYVVGGYLYGTTNQWYLPTCIYTGNGSPDIIVGYDANGYAYISVANGNYTGARISNLVPAYSATEANSYAGWTIAPNNGTENSVSVSTRRVLTTADEGSGNGIDADTLDGQHGSYYLNTSTTFGGDVSGAYNAIVVADDSHIHGPSTIKGIDSLDARETGDIPTSNGSASYMPAPVNAFLDRSARLIFSQNSGGGSWGGILTVKGWSSGYAAWQIGGSATTSTDGQLYFRDGINTTWNAWNRIWHAGNDGAGTALDADYVDGQNALEMSWGHDFAHGTFTDFNAFLNSAYFGCHFVQATTNGPGHSGATQYYQMRLALGSNYDNYALQIAIPRNVTDAQMYYRNIENSSASSWYTLGGQALTGVVVDLLTVNQINANHIAANSITAAMIQADQIDVSELKISSTASVANSIYFDGTNKRIDIKDASNVLRVRIGQL